MAHKTGNQNIEEYSFFYFLCSKKLLIPAFLKQNLSPESYMIVDCDENNE